MTSEIYGDENSDVYFAAGVDMLAYMPSNDRQLPLIEDKTYSGDFTPWGDDNLHPQNTILKVEKNDTLAAVIEFKWKALTSGGLMYGDHYTDDNGVEVYKPRAIPAIDDFLSYNEIDYYLHEAALDFYTHNNFFPGISTNLKGEAVDLFTNDAAQTRLGRQHRDGKFKGQFTDCWVHSDWQLGPTTGNATKKQCVDPYRGVVRQIRERKGNSFVIPTRPQTRGRIDYARGVVDFLIASGWVDLSSSVPDWKNAIMTGQMSVKFHIQVEKSYWNNRWKDWTTFSPGKQKQLKQDTYAKFIAFFKGAQKAGNVLFTDYHRAEKGSEEWSEWKVTIIENKTWGENAYIEDSTHSDAHIIRALGVDHTLIGLTPGKGFSAGSGSDKRVAFNQHVLMTQPEQRKILRPLDYIADLNDWHKKFGREGGDGQRQISFWFKNTFIATLDHGKETKSANTNDNSKT